MARFTKVSLGNVLTRLYKGEDYRGEVTSLIQDEFLSFSIDFMKKVMLAKLENKTIDTDWYKENFIEGAELAKEDIAIYSGLNMKTISNKYKSTRKEVVIEASRIQYDELTQAIDELTKVEPNLELTLTIKYNQASVDLSLSETLVVVNTLAVKRAAIRGGAWSSIGKNIEKPLMKSLCILYGVPEDKYNIVYKKKDYSVDDNVFSREVDFYLIDQNNKELLCEVKLMGKGNPESADAVIARDSNIFVADTLSETNKRQLTSLGVEWIELRSEKGFRKFPEVLEKLGVNYNKNAIVTQDRIKNIIDSDEIY